ncbi:MAG: hypothetical protein K2K57_01140 [Oscillospiraceae bacterium]|nr:hypothetical protein [Oscillospiraceae bacterium]
MADFSDKYRKALDSLDISPDFKERTAAKMIALRDMVETTVETAAVSASEKAGNIILMNGNVSRKKKMRRMMYTVGAIAACAAVCMGVVFSGVLDGNKNVIRYEESETAAPEQTDVLPHEEPAEEVSETVNTEETAHDEAVLDDVSYAQTSEIIVTEVPEEEMPIETRGNIATEANADKPVVTEVTVTGAPVTEAPANGVLQNAGTEMPVSTAIATTKTVPAVTTASPSRPAVTEALPTGAAEYAPPVGGNTPHEVIDDEEVITESYTPAVSPEGTENDGAAGDHDYDEADAAEEAPMTPVTSDSTSAPAFNDPAFSYSGAVGYDFSAYDEAKKFDKKNAYATITPLFEEYDEKNGKIVSYNAAEVRGTVKMRELISAAALYAEDGTWEAVAVPPENSRYIIDFADEDGNSLRGYAGDGFICYAVADMKGNEPVNEVVYCYFKLTEKESKRLEGILYSYVD